MAHERIIIKFKDSAKNYLYPIQKGLGGKAKTESLTRNDGTNIRTVITDDESVIVANKKIKVTVYKDGSIEIDPHDNTTKIK